MAEHDDDVQRLLHKARQLPRSAGDDLQWVWDAAAADPGTPEARAALERMATDGRAMLEFGIASAVLAERGRRTAAGEASAERVLAGMRRQRFQRRRRLALLVSLAAGALIGAWLWSPAAGIDWQPCEVVRVASRGDDTVALRLRLRSTAAFSPAVFLVEAEAGGVRLDRVHPLAEPLRQSPAFRAWPGQVLPGGRDVVLPPPPFDRLQLTTGQGWAFVVRGPDVADDGWVAEVEGELRAALGERLDDGAAQRAVLQLQRRGWTAQWQRVRAP